MKELRMNKIIEGAMVADRLTRASKVVQLTIHAELLASRPHARNNK